MSIPTTDLIVYLNGRDSSTMTLTGSDVDIWHDQSPAGGDATKKGNPPQLVTGERNGDSAVDFDSTQGVEIAVLDNSDLNNLLDDFTFAFWYKSNVTSGAQFSLIDKLGSGFQWFVSLDNSDPVIRTHIGGTNIDSVTDVTDLTWTFIAVTFDSTLGSNQIKVYVGDPSLGPVVQGTKVSPATLKPVATCIGCRHGVTTSNLNGKLDTVLVYKTAKDQTGVEELYNETVNAFDAGGSSSAVPEPESSSAVPEPESSSAVPEEPSSSAVLEPESSSAVPEPESSSAIPEEPSSSLEPEPESSSSAEPVPELICLEGFSTAGGSADGNYQLTGTFDGEPYWYNSDPEGGTYYIFWSANTGGRWVVLSGLSSGAGGFHFKNSPDADVNDIPGQWTDNGAGAAGTAVFGECVTLSSSSAIPEEPSSSLEPEPSSSEVPEPESSSAIPEEPSSSLEPEPESSSAVPEEPSSSLEPEPESSSAVPEPESSSAVPEEPSSSLEPEPESSSAVPEPESSSAVPEPESSSAVPEEPSSSTVPEPESSSAEPEPSSSLEPEPESSSAEPEPSSSLEPEPESSSAIPEPESSSTVSEPESSSAAPELESSSAIPELSSSLVAACTMDPGDLRVIDPEVVDTFTCTFVGSSGETAGVSIDGISFLLGDVGGDFVFDVGASQEHTFTSVGERASFTTAARTFDVVYDGPGSHSFTIIFVTVSSSSFAFSLSSSSSAQPPSCVFGIELTREISTYNVTARPQSYRMRITVTDVNNIDPNIFVYHDAPADPESGLQETTFQAVASPTDLVEYPSRASSGASPFFRLAQIDLLHRSFEVLEETWEAIKQDVEELIRTATALCELEQDEVHREGVFPGDEEEEPGTDFSPTPIESAEPLTCPDDPVLCVKITESTDPEFPVGTILSEVTVGTVEPPDCTREWEVDGAVTPARKMNIATSLVNYEADFTIEDPPNSDITKQVSMGSGYKAMVMYEYNPAETHTVSIEGSQECSSSSGTP